MPTVNPRVNVTLSPSTDVLVSRLAELRSVSKSQVLRELLDAAGPALQRVVVLLEAAQKAPREVLDGLARSLDAAQSHVEGQLQGALTVADGITTDLVSSAEVVRGRRSGVTRKRGTGAPPSRARKGAAGTPA
jgi:hypothetical protein